MLCYLRGKRRTIWENNKRPRKKKMEEKKKRRVLCREKNHYFSCWNFVIVSMFNCKLLVFALINLRGCCWDPMPISKWIMQLGELHRHHFYAQRRLIGDMALVSWPYLLLLWGHIDTWDGIVNISRFLLLNSWSTWLHAIEMGSGSAGRCNSSTLDVLESNSRSCCLRLPDGFAI